MRRLHLPSICVLFFSFNVGCSGEVVALAPESTSALAPQTCSFEPGEDPCERRFDLAPHERAEFVASATLVATLAGEAQEYARTVRGACEGILADAGQPPSSKADLAEAVKDACARASVLVAPAANLPQAVTPPDPSRCTSARTPSCLPKAANFSENPDCAGGSLHVDTPVGADPDVLRAARSLERFGGTILGERSRGARIASLSTAFADSPSALQKGPDDCKASLNALLGTALSEARESFGAVSAVLSSQANAKGP